MKYYSEKLNKVFDTERECMEAEFKVKEQENLARIQKEKALREEKEKKEALAAERKAMADKVETARKAYLEAQKAYRNELEAFCKKYGTYHYTVTDADEVPSLFDVFKYAFNW